MPDNEILTAAEIDSFSRKLKATVAHAHESTKLRALIEQFSSTLRAGGGVPAPRLPGVVTAVRATRRRVRKPALSGEAVLAVLKGVKDGLSVSDVATKLGEKDKPRVAVALRKLRDEKKITLKGKKRLARWYAQ